MLCNQRTYGCNNWARKLAHVEFINTSTVYHGANIMLGRWPLKEMPIYDCMLRGGAVIVVFAVVHVGAVPAGAGVPVYPPLQALRGVEPVGVVGFNDRSVRAGDQELYALNILDGRAYPHHPVMRQVPLVLMTVENEFLNEWNGLKVPARFDCDIFNGNKGWGAHHYFYEVITRWYACWNHHAMLQSGVTVQQPILPMIDDEYNEQVAVYQSVLRSKPFRPYVVAELGARWGTWGSRAVAMLRQVRPGSDYMLKFFEADRTSCAGLKEVMTKNALKYDLTCDFANAGNVGEWLSSVDHVDLMDIDIQGAEGVVLPVVMDSLDAKAFRLIVGTHSLQIHQQVLRLLHERGWHVILAVPPQTKAGYKCLARYLAGFHGKRPRQAERFNWAGLLRMGCFHNTTRGPVAHGDGEIIADNARFVDPAKAYSPADFTELKINDLRQSE